MEMSVSTVTRRATDLEECKVFAVHDSMWDSLVLAGKNTFGAVSLHMCFLSDELLALFHWPCLC